MLEPSSLQVVIEVVEGRVDSAHGISLEFEAIGVVEEAVEDGIGKGGVGEAGMPIVDWDLGCDQGGGTAIAVVKDLEQVLSLGARKGISEPVVQDKEV